MKKSSTLLRSLSSRLSTRLAPSPAVAPWPPVRSAYDRWLAAELDELRSDPLTPCTSAAWLSRALDLAVAVQRRLVALATGSGAGIDRKTIDECVDDTAELLDACAGLRERLDMLRSYVTAMRIALHWLEGHGEQAATPVQRAAAALAECETLERRCGAELAKCGSNIRKLGERALLHAKKPADAHHREDEALASARGVALLAVGALGAALAFRPRRAMSGVAHHSGGKGATASQWECELQEVQRHVREEYDWRRKDTDARRRGMAELDAAAVAGRAAKCAMAGGRRCPDAVAATARRRCDELEEAVAVFDERIGELQRALIDVRMVLMEWAQRSRGPELLRLAVQSEHHVQDCHGLKNTMTFAKKNCFFAAFCITR